MPSLETVQVLLAPETKALSLPAMALIVGVVSQVEVIMEIVDRVYDPLLRSAADTASPAVASDCPERIAYSSAAVAKVGFPPLCAGQSV